MNKNISAIIVIVAILAIGLIVYFTTNKKQDNTMQQTGQENQNIDTVQPATAEVPAINQTGIAKAGDTVTVNYTGKFENGKVFDTSFGDVAKKAGTYSPDRIYEPFMFTLGTGQVVKGWDEGIVGMKVGEKKHLVITPDKGYGPKDYGPIPGNSTLIFDVELLAIN